MTIKIYKNTNFDKQNLEEYMQKLTNNHNKTIEYKKKMEKVDNDYIPLFNQYHYLLKYNYNLHQLKMFIKHYKLKITGNKSQLTNRLYYHLYFSYHAIKIQKKIRTCLVKKYNIAHGPAYRNRSLCVNTSDFLTVDDLTEIPLEQFFSYKDDDGFIYGFDILSLHNLIYKCNGIIKNPYNRRPITNNIIEDLKTLLRLSKILKIPICTDIKEISNDISQEKSLELRILTLFQEIDSLGNFTNPLWFSSLNRMQLMKFIRELLDIWNFRAQLNNSIKLLICPPLGNPFPRSNPIAYLLNCQNNEEMQKFIMDILEKLVNINTDRDNRSLGAYYVLGALTLVNEEAAQSLPWLYQSFCYSL
jgi:hypothetical protein